MMLRAFSRRRAALAGPRRRRRDCRRDRRAVQLTVAAHRAAIPAAIRIRIGHRRRIGLLRRTVTESLHRRTRCADRRIDCLAVVVLHDVSRIGTDRIIPARCGGNRYRVRVRRTCPSGRNTGRSGVGRVNVGYRTRRRASIWRRAGLSCSLSSGDGLSGGCQLSCCVKRNSSQRYQGKTTKQFFAHGVAFQVYVSGTANRRVEPCYTASPVLQAKPRLLSAAYRLSPQPFAHRLRTAGTGPLTTRCGVMRRWLRWSRSRCCCPVARCRQA